MEDNVYSIRKIILKNLFWVLLIYSFFISLWAYYYLTATKVYEVKSLIQFEQKSMSNQITDNVQPFFFGSSQIEEQAKIYKSVRNLSKLIEDLDLDILVDNNFVDHSRSNFYDDIVLEADLKNQEKISLNILFEEQGFLIDGYQEDLGSLAYNTQHRIKNFIIEIKRDNDIYKNSKLSISKNSIIASVQKLSKILKVNPFLIQMTFDATLMEVVFSSSDTNLAKKVVNKLNSIYLQDSITQNSTQARASIRFLDERVTDIENLLILNEKKLNDFQEKNFFVQQDDEVKKLFDRLAVIEAQIDESKLLELEYRNKYTEDNDIYKNLIQQKDYLIRTKESILTEVSGLPKIQQEYLGLLRDVDLNIKILEDLINKKIEFSILEASTLSDVVVIDKAYDNGKVSPILSTSFILFFFFASIFAAIFLVARILFSAMKFPSEFSDISADLKLLGVIPNTSISSKASNVATDTLLTNLELLVEEDKSNSFLVCGPLSGVGKTTVSNTISEGFIKINKKVALIDCDYHRGDIHQIHKIKRPTISQLSKENFEINDYKLTENFYVIPRPKNSSEFAISQFESEDFKLMVSKIKDKVDYVIFDTPPLLSLSDALRLQKFADKIILTARHNKTKVRDVKECLVQISSVTSKEVYGIYNCYEKSQFNYGYYDYYGYKYYSSDYYYEKNEK